MVGNGTQYGIYGQSAPGGVAGQFDGNVNIRGNLTVGGSVNSNGGGIPAGTVVAFAGLTANIPSGWILCDGTAIDRRNYAGLFAAISTSWGNGDGSTTFNVPDLRGMFLRGVDNSPAKGPSGNDPDAASRNGGNNVGSVQADAVGSHTHTMNFAATSYSRGPTTNALRGDDIGDGKYPGTLYTGASGGTETRPRNAGVYWIIRAN